MSVYQLTNDHVFPHPNLSNADGLLAVGGDLSVDRLLLAYENGIFPWFNEGEDILWWSPDPRLILHLDAFKVSKSLKRIIDSKKFTVRFNNQFEAVTEACASIKRKGQDGTWITNEMKNAYFKLHELGYAHSVEVYFEEQLVGGLYGIAIGKVFCGESMFHKMPDASKVALYYWIEVLKQNDFMFIDAQTPTAHLKSLGAEEISKTEFLKLLKKALK